MGLDYMGEDKKRQRLIHNIMIMETEDDERAKVQTPQHDVRSFGVVCLDGLWVRYFLLGTVLVGFLSASNDYFLPLDLGGI